MNPDQLDHGTGRQTLQDEEGEHSQLVGLPNIHSGRTKMKWNDGEGTQELSNVTPKVTVHVDKRLQDALMDADQEREKELKELKANARLEEQKEVEELMSKAQPAIPAGWDYLILPRKINLLRVKTPPTIMQDDYFKPVKSLVSQLNAHLIGRKIYLIHGYLLIETGAESPRYSLHNRPRCHQLESVPDRSAGLPLGRDDPLVRAGCR